MADLRFISLPEQSKQKTIQDMQRFVSKTKVLDTGCVVWLGTRNGGEYGSFTLSGKTYRAHRISFMWANGIKTLSEHQFVCHSCDNPSCVNPEHLWIGTAKDNAQDNVKKGRHSRHVRWKDATHCERGHLRTPETTKINCRGWVVCLVCRNMYYPIKNERRRKERATMRALAANQNIKKV